MKILLFALFIVLMRGSVAAQEVQVPFDSSGRVQVIDQDLEKKLDLFPAYPHFLEARLYHEPDSSYILEVTSFENGQLVKDRLPKSANAIKLRREDVDARLGPQAPTVKLDQSSRSKFVIWETLLSVFGYGPFVTATLNPNNAGVGAGLELIIGGSGYLVSSVLTQNAAMTDGDASLALGGAFLGVAHGVLIDEMLSNGNSGSELGAFSTVTAIAETGIGYAIASANHMTEGTADIIRYGGLFGMMDGAGLALAINNAPSTSLWTGMSLLGSAAGFGLGTIMANQSAYTRGNASTVLTAGIYGAYIPAAIYASASIYNTSNNPSTGLALVGVAGNVSGMLLANSLMSDRHFSTAEGTAVILGTTAGFLIGSGVGYIITSSSGFQNSAWGYTIPSIVGTIAGFAITINSIGKGSGDRTSSGWNFDANPGALMGALMPRHENGAPVSIPVVSASCRF
jgi:F0F1-type ATP synthase assembly protein I